jgi:hypothetical protein
MVRITGLRRIRRIAIWRRIVLGSLSVVDRRTHLSLPALLLDRDFRVDAPVETFAFLVTLYESIVLSQIVSDTGLPATCCGLEFVPGVLLLDVVINLLRVHLASRRRRNGLMNEHHIVRRWTLQLLFGVVFDAHLWRRSTRRFDRLFLLSPVAHHGTITLLSRFQDIVAINVPSV